MTAVPARTGDSVVSGQVLVELDSIAFASSAEQVATDLAIRRLALEAERRSEPLDLEGLRVEAGRAEARRMRARAMLLQVMVQHQVGTNIDSLLAHHIAGSHIAIDIAVAAALEGAADVADIELRTRREALRTLDQDRMRAEIASLGSRHRVLSSRIERLRIRAPAAGVLVTGDTHLLLGQSVPAGKLLLEIADVRKWQAHLQLNGRDLHLVRVGHQVVLEMQAFGTSERRRFPGTVQATAEEIATESDGRVSPGRFQVLVDFDGADIDSKDIRNFRRGYAVQAQIITDAQPVLRLLWDTLIRRSDR